MFGATPSWRRRCIHRQRRGFGAEQQSVPWGFRRRTDSRGRPDRIRLCRPEGRPRHCHARGVARLTAAEQCRERDIRSPAVLIPDRMDMSTRIAAVPETFMFASRVDQAPIFVRKWLPPCGDPSAGHRADHARNRRAQRTLRPLRPFPGRNRCRRVCPRPARARKGQRPPRRCTLADAHPGSAVMRNRSAPAGRYGVKKGTQP